MIKTLNFFDSNDKIFDCIESKFQDLVPLPLDIETQVDPVIISHSKPSFTTFGYNR